MDGLRVVGWWWRYGKRFTKCAAAGKKKGFVK
jgi:hypothetical protein